jgi:ABC-type antimicrobial peptide transport system permease subunit
MVQFEKEYIAALAGLPVGAVAGLLPAALFGRSGNGEQGLSSWDARLTVPLLMAAAGAHLALLPAVEQMRMLLFSLYAAALVVSVVLAFTGMGIWRLGAVALPAGSILAYFYFAVGAHQADVIGLLVKAVELLAIIAALVPLVRRRQERARWQVS